MIPIINVEDYSDRKNDQDETPNRRKDSDMPNSVKSRQRTMSDADGRDPRLLVAATGKRKISMPPKLCTYTSAAKRLHHTISTIEGPGFSPNHALSVLLEEVEKNEKQDVEDLLLKIQNRRKHACGSLTRSSSNESIENLEDVVKTTLAMSKLTDSDLEEMVCSRRVSKDDSAFTSEDKFEESKLTKIAQYFAFGKMDLEDFGKLIGSTTLKHNFEMVTDYFLHNVEHEWGYFFELIVPLKQIHTMIIIGLVQIITVNHVLARIPLVAVYVSFFLMIYSTLQMLRSRQNLNDFIVWKKLFKIFANYDEIPNGDVSGAPGGIENRRKSGGKVELSEEDKSFTTKAFLSSYLMYFISMAVFLLSFALCSDIISNTFALFIISGLSTILSTLVLIERRNDWLKICFISANIFACLPKMLQKFGFGREWLLLKPLFGGPGDGMSGSKNNFILNFDIFSVGWIISLAIFGIIFVSGGLSSQKSVMHRTIMPCLLCALWWRTTVLLFCATDFSNMEPLNMALATSLLWLLLWPTTGIIAVILAFFFTHCQQSLSCTDLAKIVVSFAVLFSPLFFSRVLTTYSTSLTDHVDFKKRKNVYLLLFYLFLVFGSATFMYRGNFAFGSEENTTKLSWAEFNAICEKGIEGECLKRQIDCSEVKRAVVAWKGQLHSIEIIKIENFFEMIFSYFPEFLANWLRCFYGHPVDNSTSLAPFLGRNCTLEHHNLYTFQLKIVPNDQNLTNFSNFLLILAGDIFKEALFQVHRGDFLSFTAKFDEYFLKPPLKLKLISLDCVVCGTSGDSRKDGHGTIRVHVHYKDVWSKVFYAFRGLLDFVLSPVCILR